jgi:hypothetical protein
MSLLNILLAVLLTFRWCSPDLPTDKNTHVLFVGNSLTYTNNLPDLVKKEARKRGIVIKVTMIAYPDYALMDHWSDGDMQRLIASGKYTDVVVQQGPSSQSDGRAILLEYGRRIKELCDQHQVRLAFYMVWPARVNYQTFPGVIANYREAAEVTSSTLCPVGEEWKEYFDDTQDFSYYGPDQFHPSLKGSEAAARVIVDSLWGENVRH